MLPSFAFASPYDVPPTHWHVLDLWCVALCPMNNVCIFGEVELPALCIVHPLLCMIKASQGLYNEVLCKITMLCLCHILLYPTQYGCLCYDFSICFCDVGFVLKANDVTIYLGVYAGFVASYAWLRQQTGHNWWGQIYRWTSWCNLAYSKDMMCFAEVPLFCWLVIFAPHMICDARKFYHRRPYRC